MRWEQCIKSIRSCQIREAHGFNTSFFVSPYLIWELPCMTSLFQMWVYIEVLHQQKFLGHSHFLWGAADAKPSPAKSVQVNNCPVVPPVDTQQPLKRTDKSLHLVDGWPKLTVHHGYCKFILSFLQVVWIHKPQCGEVYGDCSGDSFGMKLQ